MKRFALVAALLASVAAAPLHAQTQSAPSPQTAVSILRDPGCGCCLNWVALLQKAGFRTIVRESSRRFTETRGVPDALRSCHTAMVGGYMIEGHVPIADVQRLLKERPAIAGLAVPGMPIGSPGMEQGGRTDPYQVIAFDKAGKTSVYSSHK